MMKLAFDDVSSVTGQNDSICILNMFRYLAVVNGFILTLIGLVLGLIIIFIKKLHSSSTMNNFIIVITMIIMIVGFALLISFAKWYEIIISLPMATVFASLAILWGEQLQGSERKWRILLFTICCVFAGTGFILFALGVIFRTNVLQGLAWICWCCETLIVIMFTTYYLDTHHEQEQLSEIFI
ncbi:unnamed protein product, partial [Schistosoma haematobium]